MRSLAIGLIWGLPMTRENKDDEFCGRQSEAKIPRLIIGADFVPTSSNFHMFEKGDGNALVGAELLNLIRGADFSVFNLETPLADSASPIDKCGPCLIAPTATIKGLEAVNPCAFTLANNHIMDQGASGLESTVAALEAAGLQYFGAGNDLSAAKEPLVVDVAGVSVGIYGCVEHEFSVADESLPGAAPYDPLESFDAIRELASSCDYVVVLYHGGKEHYRYPSPQLRKRCRKFAECGARLVVCQHSHCVGCKEDWAGSTIVYGQGNFLFDHSDSEFWKSSLLIEVELGDHPVVKYHPLTKMGASVRIASEAEAKEILEGFFSRSKEIESDGFVEKAYNDYAETQVDFYISCGIPGRRSLVYRVANKLCGGRLAEKLIGSKARMALLNHIECEAHSELFAAGLKMKGGSGVGR